MKTTPPANGLSVRANRCLAKAGIAIDKAALLHLLQTGQLFPFHWPAAYGSKTHQEVCRWAGVDPHTLPQRVPAGPFTIFPDIGLSYRAWRCLRRADIPTTKEAVRHALRTGALCPGRRPGSYGKTTHAELCRWAGPDAKGTLTG